ncbi:MAG: uracil-DNA glycosylase [Arenimonas sp.]
MSTEGQLSASWQRHLGAALASAPMRDLSACLRAEKTKGRVIHPPGPQIFNAFNRTPFEAVRVVILGQDPYHGPGQAHGLSFSVPDGVPPPPSLQNIFKEIERDLGLPRPTTGNLTPWSDRGVLLLNAVLTVETGKAGSHQGKGWEAFTDTAIAALSGQREGLVFMLWGAYAQAKGGIIDRSRHCVLRAPHPSPLSAHRGFLGCGHFSAANRYLQGRGQPPMDWRI